MKALTLLVLILTVGGCAAQLRPAPTAQILPGPGQPATAAAAGVRVVAQVGAWRAEPANLGGAVTPILVTIDNQSGAPLRLRPSAFALVSGDGRRFVAQAASDIHSAVANAGPPSYAFPRGYVVLSDPFFYDLYVSDDPESMWIALPTSDMIQLALPERVLEPRTTVSGFLYFPRLARNVSSVDFTATLADDRTGAPVATLTIPFVAR